VTVFQRSAAGHADPVAEIRGDITDPHAVADAMQGQEGVVHLAARVSMVGPWADFEATNVEGTRLALQAAARAGVTRFVHISSPSVAHAGEPLVGVGATAADPRSARGSYARSKAMAEVLALEADRAGFAVTALRPHLVWGPGDTQLIGRIADRARAGRLVLVDDGSALIDTTYVDNAATAIAQGLDRCESPRVRGRAFVVSNGQPRTVAELVGRIAAAAGGRAPTRHLPFPVARAAGSAIERAWQGSGRPGEPPLTAFVAEQLATAHWFDQRETRAALHWQPEVGIEEGLRRLAASFADPDGVALHGI
jgi:2-alkyl-3-oxoalkanoate reductase